MADYSFKELGFFLASGISRFHGSKFHHSASVCSMHSCTRVRPTWTWESPWPVAEPSAQR